MKAILTTGQQKPLTINGVTKIEVKDGYLYVSRNEQSIGTYSLELFEKGSNNTYLFEESCCTN